MLQIDAGNGVSLSDKDLNDYDRDGIVYLKNYYDRDSEILPIQQAIYRILGIIIDTHKLDIQQQPFSPEDFDSGLQPLIKHHRSLVGTLYDAVKKIPSYVRLTLSAKHEDLAGVLLDADFVGFANRGYGMRMDNPSEDVHLTQWHQDYVSQLCARRGVVLWSPLRDVTADMGPVEICPGSHQQGIFPIVRDGDGSYGLKIKNEGQVVPRYPSIIPEVKAGDLVVIDYLTLHRSTPNRSRKTRWAMISRYFDFMETTGISIGWKGGLQEGNSFEKVHPELSEIVA